MTKKVKVIECPAEFKQTNKVSIFLAGGITGCPDWQQEIIPMFNNTPLVLFNPRRKNFPIDDPSAAARQIKWESKYLSKASAILFWFPQETLCPIVLYELGLWTKTSKPIFIGVHPRYKRVLDVEIQTKINRPGTIITYNLHDLARKVMDWASSYKIPDLANETIAWEPESLESRLQNCRIMLSIHGYLNDTMNDSIRKKIESTTVKSKK